TLLYPPPLQPLSLHDALPIWRTGDNPSGSRRPDASESRPSRPIPDRPRWRREMKSKAADSPSLIAAAVASVLAGPAIAQEGDSRSEEHTSELQSREKLVCRLL